MIHRASLRKGLGEAATIIAASFPNSLPIELHNLEQSNRK
jgi:hypothetical protein